MGVSWYTQGFFEDYITASNSMLKGRTFEDFVASEAKKRGSGEQKGDELILTVAVLSDVKNLQGDDLRSVTAKEVWEQTKAITNYINNSPITDTPIFRGGHDKSRDLDYAAGRNDSYGRPYSNEFPEPLKNGPEDYYYNVRLQDYTNAVKRYHHKENLKKLFTPGETWDVAMLSFSYEPGTAAAFARGTGGRGVLKYDTQKEKSYVIRVIGKHRGLNISAFSPWNQQEVLANGKFRTLALHKKGEVPEFPGIDYVVDVEEVL